MRALIVGALPWPDAADFYGRLFEGVDLVVAADAGALFCLDHGRRPDLAVGDFDSAGERGVERLAAAGVVIERHPVAKDASDLDLAVEAARGLGVSDVLLTAAFGGRMDHTLAALGTLMRVADLGGHAVEPTWTAWPLVAGVRDVLHLTPRLGATVSLVSPTGATGVSASGLEYALERADLEPMASLGISNVSCGGPIRVSLERGTLIVMVAED